MGAPVELISEFLACIMAKQYAAAAPLCEEILRLEPGNETARQFRPLIVEAQALAMGPSAGDVRYAVAVGAACIILFSSLAAYFFVRTMRTMLLTSVVPL